MDLGFPDVQEDCAVAVFLLTKKWPDISEIESDDLARAQQKVGRGLPIGFFEDSVEGAMIFGDNATRDLKNVVIFRPGIHTDSQGRTKSFERVDLQKMVSAFWSGIPESIPIKMGHSSAEFNKKIADALQLPIELLIGEGERQTGAVRLGEIIGLHLNGVLTADLRLPEKVAQLIKDGFFTANSPEIVFGRTHTFPSGEKEEVPITLSALSLLGAQRPAISGSPGLQAGTMLTEYSDYKEVEVGVQKRELLLAQCFTECDFSEQEGTFDEGSKKVSADAASDGTPNASTWTVPIRDLGRGTFVQASVSAANEASAKTIALRVVENFLFNVGGPLGKVIGGTLGILFARRLVVGKPIKGAREIGRLFWKFTEEGSEGKEFFEDGDEVFTIFPDLPDDVQIALQEKIMSQQKSKEELAEHAPEGVSSERWQACLTKARADGVENPEAHCKSQLGSSGGNGDSMATGEMAKALGLSEWADNKAILEEIAKLRVSSQAFTEQGESVKSMETKLLTMEYSAETAKLEHYPGKPEEMATQLVRIHQEVGADSAKGMLKAWQVTDGYAEQAGVTKAQLAQGSAKEEETSTYEEKLVEYKEAHPDVSERDVNLITMKAHPRLYRVYADKVSISA